MKKKAKIIIIVLIVIAIIISAIIIELEPGESTQLSTNSTFDYANAYDFSISKR